MSNALEGTNIEVAARDTAICKSETDVTKMLAAG